MPKIRFLDEEDLQDTDLTTRYVECLTRRNAPLRTRPVWIDRRPMLVGVDDARPAPIVSIVGVPTSRIGQGPLPELLYVETAERYSQEDNIWRLAQFYTDEQATKYLADKQGQEPGRLRPDLQSAQPT